MVKLSKQRLENVQGGGLINPRGLDDGTDEGQIGYCDDGKAWKWWNGEWIPFTQQENTNNINQ